MTGRPACGHDAQLLAGWERPKFHQAVLCGGAVNMADKRMRRPRRRREPAFSSVAWALSGRRQMMAQPRLRKASWMSSQHLWPSADVSSAHRLASAARQVGAVLWLAFRLTRAALNCRWSSGLLPGRPPLAALVSALMQPRARLAVAAAEPGKAVLASTGKRRPTVMDVATQTLPVARGPYRLYAEVVPGPGVPVVLMHGFPDNTHLYDRLVPHLAGRRPVVRFDFLGWGRSDKPAGYPYTAANQAGDLAVVADAVQEH